MLNWLFEGIEPILLLLLLARFNVTAEIEEREHNKIRKINQRQCCQLSADNVTTKRYGKICDAEKPATERIFIINLIRLVFYFE